MYFCYVDESGDCGVYDSTKPTKTGSKYFILAGIFLNVSKWKITLDTLKSFRKKIAREGFLPYNVEFHCAEMIDPHKVRAFTSISVKDRWKLLEEYAEVIGQTGALTIISVVIDKSMTSLTPDKYLTSSITALYEAFDEFLRKNRTNGLVFFDRANERVINTHIRTLLGTGISSLPKPEVHIGWIIEDPIFRISTDSMFIQSADLVAYSLKEKEFPTGARKKYFADRIFKNKLMKRALLSSKSDEDGIIRL